MSGPLSSYLFAKCVDFAVSFRAQSLILLAVVAVVSLILLDVARRPATILTEWHLSLSWRWWGRSRRIGWRVGLRWGFLTSHQEQSKYDRDHNRDADASKNHARLRVICCPLCLNGLRAIHYDICCSVLCCVCRRVSSPSLENYLSSKWAE